MTQTTAFDIVAWLYEQGRGKPDACPQERDWCDKMNAAALEIERLREVVWLYVDPFAVKHAYKPIVARCAQ
jgi:hypothetical protein